MKNIFFVLLTILLAFGSCQKDTGVNVNAGEKEVDIEIKVPGVATRAGIPAEDRIDRLDVLVFQGTGDNAKFLYRRYAWPRTGTTSGYRTTLKTGKDLTIFFAANAQNLLDNVPSHIFDEKNGTLWSEVMEALVLTSPQSLSHSAGLPMWGHLTGQTIEDEAVNNLGKVSLLRAVASADFELTSAASADFELESVYLVYGADKGYLPYHSSQLSPVPGTLEAILPYCPTGMTTSDDWKYDVPSGELEVNNVFYMFDNDAEMPSEPEGRKQSKLIMKGTWTDPSGHGRPTYYPIAFREENEDGEMERKEVIRNIKYMISVTGVNGDGFDNLTDAKEGEEINLEYKVIDWNKEKDTELIISGNQWVSLERKQANIFRVSSWTAWDRIGMSTSYNKGDIRLSADKSTPGAEGVTNIYLKDEKTGVEFCRVLLTEENGRFIFNFFTTLALIDPDKSVYRQTTLYVKVGMITFEIAIRQHNMLLNDWEDGGEIIWP